MLQFKFCITKRIKCFLEIVSIFDILTFFASCVIGSEKVPEQKKSRVNYFTLFTYTVSFLVDKTTLMGGVIRTLPPEFCPVS
jgi:hypothetical protein